MASGSGVENWMPMNRLRKTHSPSASLIFWNAIAAWTPSPAGMMFASTPARMRPPSSILRRPSPSSTSVMSTLTTKPRSSNSGAPAPLNVSRMMASEISTRPRSSAMAIRPSIQNEPVPIATSTMRSSSPRIPSICHRPGSSISSDVESYTIPKRSQPTFVVSYWSPTRL